jgi:dephospho-CoA kinase
MARVEDIESVVVVEVPLLGHGLGDGWKRVIVDCRDEVRIERAVQRGMTETDARARLAAQPSRSEWLAVADVVIPNHGSVEELEQAVAHISGRL